MMEPAGNGRKRWVELALSSIDRLGVTVVFLGFLLAQDAGWIPSKSRETLAAVQAHDAAVVPLRARRIESEAELTTVLKGMRDEMKRRVRLDQAICLSLTREPDLRRACVELPVTEPGR